MMQETEVVIIGAGLAGLAAAKELLKQKKSVTVVEARNRIGGRAHTDLTTFPVPFDHGCSWVHSPEINPLRSIIKEYSLDLIEDNEYSIFIEEELASINEMKLIDDAARIVDNALRTLGKDISLEEALHDIDSLYVRLAAKLIAFVSGLEIDQVSTKGTLEEVGTLSNEIVKQGLGRFVSLYGANIPISLNTIVTEINYEGKDIVITTNNGNIKAKKVIITVPLGVLLKEQIKFTPKMSSAKIDAINGFQMGHFNKIACLFNSKLPELKENHYIIMLGDQRPRVASTLNSYNSALSITFVSGNLAKDLEIAGQEAAINFALSELSNIFGNRIKNSYVRGVATTWSQDQFSHGAYSAPKPGSAHLRSVLKKPIDNRIFFAGEAYHDKWMTHLTGAYLSGIETAQSLLKDL